MSGTFRLYRLALLLAAMLLATFALGWSGVLFAAVTFAILDRRPEVPLEAALGAALAWAILLLMHILPSATATAGGPSLVGTVASAMGIPPLIPPLVTIAFPALLAWSSATVTVTVLHLVGHPRRLEESTASSVVG